MDSEQYRTPGRLLSRERLHGDYSVNQEPWQRWLFQQLQLSGEQVLELGCGRASLWHENADRIPSGLRVTLSDASRGMLAEARRRLEGILSCTYLEADACAIPSEDRCFDVVIANHMLYHVEELPKALSEIRRVLRPGGTLYAATNGRNHLAELFRVLSHCYPYRATDHAERFGLESGPRRLAPFFSSVRVVRYPDRLIVPDPEPLVAYAVSVVSQAERSEELLSCLRGEFSAALESGPLEITKDTGLIVASL